MKFWPRRTETPKGRLLSDGNPQPTAHRCSTPAMYRGEEAWVWDGENTETQPAPPIPPIRPILGCDLARRLARIVVLAPGAEWACECGVIYHLDGAGRWVPLGLSPAELLREMGVPNKGYRPPEDVEPYRMDVMDRPG